jgi:hypothetical protein
VTSVEVAGEGEKGEEAEYCTVGDETQIEIDEEPLKVTRGRGGV